MKDMTASTLADQQPVIPLLRSRSAKSVFRIPRQSKPLFESANARSNKVGQGWKSSAFRPLILNGRVSRPFASYYYTSSFLSLYSTFDGDGLVSASQNRPNTTATNKRILLSSYRPLDHVTTSKEENSHKSPVSRFPWRHCGLVTSTNAEEVNKGKQQNDESLKDAAPKISSTKSESVPPVKAKQSVNGGNVTKAASSEERSGKVARPNIGESKTTESKSNGSRNSTAARTTSSGHRTRSMSLCSRPASFGKSTPKTKHHSSDRREAHVAYHYRTGTIPLWPPGGRTIRGNETSEQQSNAFVKSSRSRASHSSPSILRTTSDVSKSRYVVPASGIKTPFLDYNFRVARSCPATPSARERSRVAHTQSARSSPLSKPRRNGSKTGQVPKSEVIQNSSDAGSDSARNEVQDLLTNGRSKLPDKNQWGGSGGSKKEVSSKVETTRLSTAPDAIAARDSGPRSLADLSCRQRPLTDINPADIYKDSLRAKTKTLLSPEQLVIRESVEKVQRWIRTLPCHFDTIHHVLPPVRQDY